jgi:hypothetical protein
MRLSRARRALRDRLGTMPAQIISADDGLSRALRQPENDDDSR